MSKGLNPVKRYEAMLKRVEGKPIRTLGDLFALRLAVLSDIEVVDRARGDLLERVYGGQTEPPELAKSRPYPTHRRLFYTLPSKDDRLRSITFGWSYRDFRDPRIQGETAVWTMSWSEDWFKGYGDPRLVREVVGRDPKNEIDELVCAGLVAEALEANDEELGRAFANVQHRLNQLWYRHAVVKTSIEHSLLKILADEHGWRPGRDGPWRKVMFEDGSVVTLTSEGVMMFGDVVVTTRVSLALPSENRSTWANNLKDRQRRALERA
jgi:hypothetical protein